MANEWSTAPLGELCLKITDGAHSSPPSVQFGKKMASVKDLTRFGVDLKDARHISKSDFDFLVKQGCQPQVGDVLIAKDGNSALDTTCLVKKPLDAVLLSSVAILRPNPEKLFPEFLKQHLSSQRTIEYLKSEFISGAAIPRVILKDFKRAIINVPPLKEQRAIAHILGTLDDKIELNRRANETLESMARTLFKAWFVDFEPVRAKLEGRWQRGQSLPGLPAHLYEQFPDGLVESELGAIPEGWRHSTIGEEVTVCGGSTPSTKEPDFWEGGHHCWVTPKDLSALMFPVLLDTDRKITDAGLAKISSGLLPVGTVLLSSRAPIGYLAIAEVPTAINQGFIAMKCDGALPNAFVLPWCRESMDAIVGNANGSTFQEISKSNFRPLPVVVPSDPVLTSFTKSADSLYRQLVENERESSALAQLRDTLLPKLISGEIRIDGSRALGQRDA